MNSMKASLRNVLTSLKSFTGLSAFALVLLAFASATLWRATAIWTPSAARAQQQTACATPSFGGRKDIAVGGGLSSPQVLAVADLNSDGRLDFVTPSSNAFQSVILNAAGDLVTSSSIAEVGASSVALADFNADGKPDFAGTSSSGNRVVIALNTATTGAIGNLFGAPAFQAVQDNPVSIVAADFNGDGKADIATANQNAGSVSLLLNNASGGFNPAVHFPVSAGPLFLLAGDFNGDNKLDLAVGHTGANNAALLLNNGTGGFNAAQNITDGANRPYWLAQGDFNGDGKLDLVLGNAGGNNAQILLNTGVTNGVVGFTAMSPAGFTTGQYIAPVAADFNLDGKLDLAFCTGDLNVALGDGTGRFSALTSFELLSTGFSTAAGDFNGDGRPDVLVRYPDSRASLLLNTCTALLPNTCVNPPAGLVAWYRGENNANDAAGANNGTLQGGATFAGGKVGQAFSLDGMNDFVEIPNATALNPTTQLTLEAWINPTTLSNSGSVADTIFRKNDPAESDGYLLDVLQGKLRMYVAKNGGTIDVKSTAAIQANAWTHVAATYDGTQVKLYLNGVLDGTQNTSGSFIANMRALRLGADARGDSRFNGRIDEASVFTRALTQAEIQAIYNASSAGKCFTQPSLAITAQPQNVTVCAPQPATFAVTATGANLSYQWRKNGTPIQGATANSLTIQATTVNDAGSYDVVVTSGANSLTSSAAVLTVNTAPLVNGQPRNQATTTGGSVTFSAQASGAASVQWQVATSGGAFTNLTGATNFVLTLSNATVGLNGNRYRAVFTNACGSVNSSEATLTVTAPPPPPVLSAVTVTNIGTRTAQVNFSADKAITGIVQVAANATFVNNGATSGDPQLTQAVNLSRLEPNTMYRVRVQATDAVGQTVTSTEVSFITAKLAELAITELTLSNNAPTVGTRLTMTARVKNQGQLSLTGVIVFLDGTREISRQNVTSPALGNDVLATSPQFTLSEGARTLTARLESIQPSDEVPTNNSISRDLRVGPPVFSLITAFGGLRTWPGNDSLATVTVTNNGSIEQIIAALQVQNTPWITRVSPLPTSPLMPSESVQITFRVQPPLGLLDQIPAGGSAVVRPNLRVTASRSYDSSFTVELFRAPIRLLEVMVVDATTYTPINGATVAVSNSNTSYRTGADGKPRDGAGNPVMLPYDGQLMNVYATAVNYQSGEAMATGETVLFVPLKKGAALKIDGVAVTELSAAEIAARGINVTDPANTRVVDYTLKVGVQQLVVTNVQLPRNPQPGAKYTGEITIPQAPPPPPAACEPLVGDPTLFVDTPDGRYRPLFTWEADWDLSLVGKRNQGCKLGLRDNSNGPPNQPRTLITLVCENNPVLVLNPYWLNPGDKFNPHIGYSEEEVLRYEPASFVVGETKCPRVRSTQGTPITVQYQIDYTSATERRETFIIIPGGARILKQFFDATIFVRNITSGALTNAQATLDLPAGLAFPDLNGAAQPAMKPFGNIPANGSGQVQWAIRGDVPGKYQVTGTATAQGFAPTSLQSNEFEVIEPRLSVSLDLAQAPATLTVGQQFRIGVKVRNDSIGALQGISVFLKPEELVNVTVSGAASQNIGTLAPNETKTVFFDLISSINGAIKDLGRFSAGQTISFPFELIPNQAPVITGGAALTRQRGASGAATLATVTDADSPLGNLTVTVSDLPSGITITNLTNANGTITANVTAGCNAAVGANSITLNVSDGTQARSSLLTINVTENAAPTLGDYPNSTIPAGPAAFVAPTAPPTDDRNITNITVTGLTGATVNSVTGVITIPANAAAGRYTLTVTVTDDCGQTVSRGFTLTIGQAPIITAANALTRQQGSAAATAALATVSGAGNLTVTATTVPTGLTLTNITNTNGAITALVAAACNATAGANTVVLTVSDGTATATANLIVNVTANTAPVLGSYPATSVAVGGNVTITPLLQPSDNGTIASVEITAPGIVAFLGVFNINTTTGVVTITNARPAGGHPLLVTVTDNCGAKATQTINLTVTATCATITINPATLPNAPVNVAYNQTLTASGGTAPYTFSLMSGGLPNGLTLNGNGTITGAPTSAGNATVTVKATDANGCTATRDYALVSGNPTPVLIALAPSSATVGSGPFALIVTGTNFVNGASVVWNQSVRSATFISATQLRADIPASDIATAGTATITVNNPGPGGGVSNPLTFTINPNTSIRYEGGVWPRAGDGIVDARDVRQMVQFILRRATAAPGGQYQRADAAPKASKGDRRLTTADLVQISRYAAGLDPLVEAGGPTTGTLQDESGAFTESGADGEPLQLLQTGTLTALAGNFTRGQIGEVTIQANAIGGENAVSFTLLYDGATLSFLDAIKANTLPANLSTAELFVNDDEPGKVGVLLLLPAGQTLPAGVSSILSMRFLPNGGAGVTNASFTFGDDIIAREATDAAASTQQVLATTNVSNTVSGNAPAFASAASYRGGAVAPVDSIVAVFGVNLATATATGNTIPLPTTLAGTTVTLTDSANQQFAVPLFFVSSGQINCLIPAGVATGAATITIRNSNGETTTGLLRINEINPGLFAAAGNGRGLAAAQALHVFADGSQRYENVARFDTASNQFVAVPIDLSNVAEQVFLVLYGTGLRGRSALNGVTATMGGTAVETLYAGAQGSLVGLDQVNLRLPPELAGRGDMDVALNIDGKAANTARVNVK